MQPALIVAPGLDLHLAEFLISKVRPSHVAFLVTDATISMVPALCQKLQITSHKFCFIKDIFSTSETIQEFLNAFYWLRDKPDVDTIYVDATNCITVIEMSTYLSASFLDLYRDVLGHKSRIKLVYTHCQFSPLGDGRFVEIKDSEELVELERPVDALGFILIVEGINAFNRGRYHQAVDSFTAAANAATGEKSLFYSGLLDLAAAYELWDRLSYSEAATKLTATRSAILKAKAFSVSNAIVATIDTNLWALDKLQGSSETHVVIDLFQNALRREREGRHDDAMARLYACLERMIQHRLRAHGIDTAAPNYDQLSESVVIEFNRLCGDRLPHELELRKGCLLLSLCDDPLGEQIRLIGLKTVTGLIGIRNHSILAHGLKPVRPEHTQKFGEHLVAPLLSAYLELSAVSDSESSAFVHFKIPAVEDLLRQASIEARPLLRPGTSVQ
jgi:CRISPR-associated protein (TIGR02710 family)